MPRAQVEAVKALLERSEPRRRQPEVRSARGRGEQALTARGCAQSQWAAWAVGVLVGLVVGLLMWRWQALVTATVSEDLAHASGLNPDRERLVLTLALAVVVALALKIVGALLIAAMLIIPAAAARGLARSPETMALLAVVIGAGASLLGLQLSLWQDTPAGPSIIVAAAAIFALSVVFGQFRR